MSNGEVIRSSPVPSDEVITSEEILQTSQNLWQTDLYGQNALGHLDLKRILHPLDHVYTLVNPYVIICGLGDELDMNTGHMLSGDIGDANTPLDTILANVESIWNRVAIPYELEIQAGSNLGRLHPQGQNIELKLVPKELTRRKLAHYLQKTGFANHALHGALAKNMDTMNFVSGVKRTKDIRPDNTPREYVPYIELKRQIKEAGLSQHYRREIMSQIFFGMHIQLRTGRPAKEGEIIVEGKTEERHTGRELITFECIATSSLVRLADQFRQGTPAKHFLRSFA